ncbi:hypothetical protein ARMSODRAFT_299323 [Armillaria solidipes]|uniref:Uncharacterized protein n=1 Tax=Armillaria solidipes TaxID=1076256 RepID=A0A2H3BFP1_9AGAR|nr:hypothetical protein ARMSODRAFT_299323 [Armillaria solidipes]
MELLEVNRLGSRSGLPVFSSLCIPLAIILSRCVHLASLGDSFMYHRSSTGTERNEDHLHDRVLRRDWSFPARLYGLLLSQHLPLGTSFTLHLIKNLANSCEGINDCRVLKRGFVAPA